MPLKREGGKEGGREAEPLGGEYAFVYSRSQLPAIA